jgi:cellulose biosynthesis protein BcsS
VDPTKHNNIFGMVDYSTNDGYVWSRLAFKEQIANHDWSGRFTPFIGVEGIAQGNKDIRSTQFGPFVEVVHVPSTISIMLRGGWKRSAYQVGPDRTGPWVAIGFYRRL